MAFKMKNPAMAKLAKAAGSGMPLKKPSMARHESITKGPDGKDKRNPHTHTEDGRIDYGGGKRTLDPTHKDYVKNKKIAREKTLKKMKEEGRDTKKVEKGYKREDKIREKKGQDPIKMKKAAPKLKGKSASLSDEEKMKQKLNEARKSLEERNKELKKKGENKRRKQDPKSKTPKEVKKPILMKKKSMSKLNKGFDKLPKDVQAKILKKDSAGKMGHKAAPKMKKAAGKMKKAVTKLGVGGAIGTIAGKVFGKKKK